MIAQQVSSLSQPQEVVHISYNELLRFSEIHSKRHPSSHDVVIATRTNNENQSNDDLQKLVLDKIRQAFGNDRDCLGIIAVSGIPNFSELRQRVLPMARLLANLSTEDLNEITVPTACYSVGWSHGKEKLAGPNNPPDLAKGSFCANPITDNLLDDMKQRNYTAKNERSHPALNQCRRDGVSTNGTNDHSLDELAAKNPAFFAPNVWPKKSLPQLEGALKEFGQLIATVGCLLARPCDVFVQQQCPTYKSEKLHTVLSTSRYAKARLLHYFSKKTRTETDTDFDHLDGAGFADWCAWHKDHGSLTGLVPAMYLDPQGREVSSPPDPMAGLYIQTRAGQIAHVQLPKTVLAFQLGETSQIHTGGILRATPHAVRGPKPQPSNVVSSSSTLTTTKTASTSQLDHVIVTRETLAVFLEPEYHGDMSLPSGRSVQDIEDDLEYLPKSISPIQSRWKPGQNFGEFTNATFGAFY